MSYHRRNTTVIVVAIAIFGAAAFLAVLYRGKRVETSRTAEPAAIMLTSQVTRAAISGWQELQERTPVAHTTAQPEPLPGPLDGTYAKLDPSWPQWWLCRRCADYRHAGGIWKLQLEKGVMRIYYDITGWRSLASFSVDGDRMYLFNDPYCPDDVGEYAWKLEGGELTLETVEDACAFGLRAENFSLQPWLGCVAEADGEQAPGCAESPEYAADIPSVDPGLSVNVYEGDIRLSERKPEFFVYANAAEDRIPENFRIAYDEGSISYGLQRVLWWQGDWIEASTDGAYTSIGVQFLGDPSIGWARVLLDGGEVWRGNTAEIWSKLGRHGGYVEVTGLEAGEHTLRVESLGFDYRPVTVTGFGFDE